MASVAAPGSESESGESDGSCDFLSSMPQHSAGASAAAVPVPVAGASAAAVPVYHWPERVQLLWCQWPPAEFYNIRSHHMNTIVQVSLNSGLRETHRLSQYHR